MLMFIIYMELLRNIFKEILKKYVLELSDIACYIGTSIANIA